ncbi:MAG: sensor histidine kinase [Burkholderiaceae bacterium]
MNISRTVTVLATTFLVLSLGGSAIALWTTNRSNFYDERIRLARDSYELHLRLSSNTYQLFKQYSDTILIGHSEQTSANARKKNLIGLIRENIAGIRAIINSEIELVGNEELEEFELLSVIDNTIKNLTASFETLQIDRTPGPPDSEHARLSLILEQKIDRDFHHLIALSLAEEKQEVAQARSAADEHRRLASALALGFSALAIALTLVSLLAYRAQIINPLGRVMTGVRRLADGTFDRPINLTGLSTRNELYQVGSVLDQMAATVARRTDNLLEQNASLEDAVRERTDELEHLLVKAKESASNRQRMMADVSHELRTPLTIIQGESDIALRGKEKSGATYRDALTRTREAAAHTAMLVNDLLFISRQEAGEARLAISTYDLNDLVKEVANLSAPGIKIGLCDGSAPAQVDGVKIRQAILALLQNARLHGGNATAIQLSRTGENYQIQVEDDGPGLSDLEKEKAFERYFRGSNAATSYSDGTGLGLPVVRSILEAHGGSATLQDRPEGGLSAIMTFPATQPSTLHTANEAQA